MSDVRHEGVVENRDNIDPGNADVGAAAEAVVRRATRFVGVFVRGTLSRGRHRQGLLAAVRDERIRCMRCDIGRKAKQFGPARPGQKQFVRGEREEAHRNHSPHARRKSSLGPTWVSFPQRAVTYHVRKSGGKVRALRALLKQRFRDHSACRAVAE